MREREGGPAEKKIRRREKWKSGFLRENVAGAGLLAIPKLTNHYSFLRKLGIIG
jgi:hypothetical protein